MSSTMLTCAVFLVLGAGANAMSMSGKVGYGFVGYGINMYHPWCAQACKDTLGTSGLVCNDTVADMNPGHSGDTGGMNGMSGMNMKKRMDMDMDMGPSVDCIASNGPFLQSLAYCVDMHCAMESTVDEVETWWNGIMLGRDVGQPIPAMSFSQALAKLSQPPNATQAEGAMMEHPVLIDEEAYVANYNADGAFETVEERHAQYGIILLVTCAAIPIALSSLSWIPFPAAITSKFSAYFIDAPLFPRPLSLPFVGPLNLPNRGQSLFVLYIIGLNIILCSVGYTSRQPNAWFDSTRSEILTYITNRTGVLSFANVPLLILYAGRNNILLFITNWSHSTFLILHRVVAVLATLEACVHSAIYLQLKLADGTHSSESKLAYWIWGIIGTLAMSLLLPLSIRYIRCRAYEVFLVTHILLSVFAIVGCWYHIICRFGRQWGYEAWLYIAIAVWGFDRLARFARIGRWGLKRARVYKVDEDYLRVDIDGVSAAGHVYVYFPTITWKVWENHPFSVAGIGHMDLKADVGLSRKTTGSQGDTEKNYRDDGSSDDIRPAAEASSSVQALEKNPSMVTTAILPAKSKGITLFVRNREGTTYSLAKRASPLSNHSAGPSVPVLVEGSYGVHSHNSLAALAFELDRYPNILFVIGGVGITAFLPLLQDLRGVNPKLLPNVTAKLYWGVRSPALVSAVGQLLDPLAEDQSARWGMVEPHVTVGGRLDLAGIADKELGKKGTMVFVCGPQSLADEARRVVMLKAKQGSVVKYVEEKFDW